MEMFHLDFFIRKENLFFVDYILIIETVKLKKKTQVHNYTLSIYQITNSVAI